LVKYVSIDPDPTQFSARVGTDLGYTNDAGGANWGVHGVANLPIVTDVLAARISAFKNDDAGWISNIGTGVPDANASTRQGGRVALLWHATDRLTVRAAFLTEDDKADSISVITMNGFTQKPLYGPQVVDTHFAQPYDQTTRNYSLSVDWDLGFATLTSATGESQINWSRGGDYSVPYGAYCAPGKLTPTNQGCVDYPYGNALALYDFGGDSSKFVEEVRLASSEKQRVQWMLGGFFTKEDTVDLSNLEPFTPSLQPLPLRNALLISRSPASYKESAGFANLTYKLTDLFDVSGGVRHSVYSETAYNVTESGVIYGTEGGVNLTPPNNTLSNVGVTTWMADTRFHPSENAMLYARVATGYRPGNGCKFYSNGTPCGTPSIGVPGFVNPDRTTNYEVGLKGQFLDQRLQLDMTVFYIHWVDIQISTISPEGVDYAGNGGTASSQGVEFNANYQIAEGLHLNTTVAQTNAHLTENAPGVGGMVGDRLPEAPVWTGSVTADYIRPMGDMSLLLGGGYRYRDAIVNLLEHTGEPTPMGPQNIFDAYTGLKIRNLTLRLRGSNVFNNHSYAGLILLSNPKLPEFVPVQPRTFTLSADYQF
jgi:outer membrane receptor protein involved in Fe transport